MKTDQSGITHLIIPVVLVLFVVGAVLLFVMSRAGTPAPSAVTTPSTTPVTETAPDPTASWKTYSNAAGKFSFKHPASWVFASSPELCTETLVLFAHEADRVGRCAADSFGEMYASGTSGDSVSEQALSAGYVSVQKKTVTLGTVSGTRYSAVASGQQSGDGPGGLPDGTKTVKYVFYANGRTYAIVYASYAQDADILSDFDTLVTRTFTFTD